jgi:hypothetical protein
MVGGHTCDIGAKTIWESWKLGDSVGIIRGLEEAVSRLFCPSSYFGNMQV